MMDKVDYEHLEILLAKLSKEIGHNRFCIIPSYIQDGCYIGIYKEDGNIDKQVTGINIEDAMRMLQCST
jgi:hypothetical protein